MIRTPTEEEDKKRRHDRVITDNDLERKDFQENLQTNQEAIKTIESLLGGNWESNIFVAGPYRHPSLEMSGTNIIENGDMYYIKAQCVSTIMEMGPSGTQRKYPPEPRFQLTALYGYRPSKMPNTIPEEAKNELLLSFQGKPTHAKELVTPMWTRADMLQSSSVNEFAQNIQTIIQTFGPVDPSVSGLKEYLKRYRKRYRNPTQEEERQPRRIRNTNNLTP